MCLNRTLESCYIKGPIPESIGNLINLFNLYICFYNWIIKMRLNRITNYNLEDLI